MAYKDLEKKREREKERSKRYRLRKKGVTGVTENVTIAVGVTQPEKIIKTKEDAKKVVTQEDAARKFTICPQHKVFRYTCRCP